MKNWIKAPIKLDRSDYLSIAPVRVAADEIPAGERNRYRDEHGEPLVGGEAERIGGYFAIVEDAERLAARELSDIFLTAPQT